MKKENLNNESNKKLQIFLKTYEHSYNLINNFVSSLFTVFTGIVASAIIGVFVNIDKIINDPNILLIFLIIAWLLLLLLSGFIILTFLITIYYGFKILQIEKNLLGEFIFCGEKENFVLIEDSKFLDLLSTRLFYPGLLISGFTHKFLKLLTFIIIIFDTFFCLVSISLINYINNSMNIIKISIPFFKIIIRNNYSLNILLFIFFIFFGFYIMPRLLPYLNNFTENIKNCELLIISETLSPLHGTEASIIGFIKSLNNNFKKKVALIGPLEKNSKQIRDISFKNKFNLILLPSIKTKLLGQPDFYFALPFLLNILINDKIKYIYINGFPGLLSIYSLYLSKKRKKKIIFHYHLYLPKFIECIPIIGKFLWIQKFIIILTTNFCNKCDIVIAPSNQIKSKLIEWGVKENIIKIIPTGVDKFFLKKPNIELVEKLKNNFTKPILLYVGRLSQEKNIKLLIYSFKKIKENFNNASLLIIGEGPDKYKLIKLTNNLNLNNVYFLGYQNWDNLIYYYWASDIFCMPSIGETQGLTILEAKACGKPCIVLNKLGASEQIKNYEDGILVNEGETFEETIINYSSAIKNLINNPELMNELSLKAKENSLNYTIKESSKIIYNLFKNDRLFNY